MKHALKHKWLTCTRVTHQTMCQKTHHVPKWSVFPMGNFRCVLMPKTCVLGIKKRFVNPALNSLSGPVRISSMNSSFSNQPDTINGTWNKYTVCVCTVHPKSIHITFSTFCYVTALFQNGINSFFPPNCTHNTPQWQNKNGPFEIFANP